MSDYPDVLRALLTIQKAERMLDAAMADYRKGQLNLGTALRASRIARGISLREIARRLKLSAPFISDCELGRRSLSEKHRLKYQEILRPNLKLD